jgi:hypothetical protein
MYYLFILAAMVGQDAKFLCSSRFREFVSRLLNSPVCHKFAQLSGTENPSVGTMSSGWATIRISGKPIGPIGLSGIAL